MRSTDRNIIVICMLAFFAGAVYLVLSANKFCVENFEFHSEKQAFVIALKHLSDLDIINADISSDQQALTYIADNPNCCERDIGIGEAKHYPILDMILAKGVHVVSIVAPSSEKRRKSGPFYKSYVRVSCGKVTGRSGEGLEQSEI